MDRLCGNAGMAEDLPWVLRRGVFEREVPYGGELSTALNQVRRQLIKIQHFDAVPADLLASIQQLRTESREKLDRWAAHHDQIQELARERPKPGERRVEGTTVASNAFFIVSRKHAEADIALWGPFRPEEEQRREQREIAAFELARLLKSRHRHGYNVREHEGDYNDGWLLAYLAAGYRLVTSDRRLGGALEMGGCEDPRVSDIEEALDLAEAWRDSR